MFFRLTGLSFITQFTFNSTIKIITVLVFWYSKNFIWEIAYFQLLHYVSEAYLSIYVFDTCCNFNDDYFKWSQTKKERALFLSIISAAVALFSFVKMFKFETESPL